MENTALLLINTFFNRRFGGHSMSINQNEKEIYLTIFDKNILKEYKKSKNNNTQYDLNLGFWKSKKEIEVENNKINVIYKFSEDDWEDIAEDALDQIMDDCFESALNQNAYNY